jgi:hypothetical protein
MKGVQLASWALLGAQGLQQPLALHSHSLGDTSSGAAVGEVYTRLCRWAGAAQQGSLAQLV